MQHHILTLLGTNISPEKSILKMIFLFPRWDMLISWRVLGSNILQYKTDLLQPRRSRNVQQPRGNVRWFLSFFQHLPKHISRSESTASHIQVPEWKTNKNMSVEQPKLSSKSLTLKTLSPKWHFGSYIVSTSSMAPKFFQRIPKQDAVSPKINEKKHVSKSQTAHSRWLCFPSWMIEVPETLLSSGSSRQRLAHRVQICKIIGRTSDIDGLLTFGHVRMVWTDKQKKPAGVQTYIYICNIDAYYESL